MTNKPAGGRPAFAALRLDGQLSPGGFDPASSSAGELAWRRSWQVGRVDDARQRGRGARGFGFRRRARSIVRRTSCS